MLELRALFELARDGASTAAELGARLWPNSARPAGPAGKLLADLERRALVTAPSPKTRRRRVRAKGTRLLEAHGLAIVRGRPEPFPLRGRPFIERRGLERVHEHCGWTIDRNGGGVERRFAWGSNRKCPWCGEHFEGEVDAPPEWV